MEFDVLLIDSTRATRSWLSVKSSDVIVVASLCKARKNLSLKAI